MIRRSTLKVDDAPAPRSSKPRCGSCGVVIPQLDGRPFRCSYCVGDPFFGKDGYLLDMVNEALEHEPQASARRLHLLMALNGSTSAMRRHAARQAFGPVQ